MSKETTLIFLGVLISIVPFIGLPAVLQTASTILFAILVILIGISLKKKLRKERQEEITSDSRTVTHDQETSRGE